MADPTGPARGDPSPPRPSDDELRRRRAELDARLGPDPHDEAGEAQRTASRSDLSRGLKLSSEFIAGVVVGAGLGWFIDRTAGTAPFGLIVFLLLGFAAGMLNVLREVGAVAQPGLRPPPRDARAPDAPKDEGRSGD